MERINWAAANTQFGVMQMSSVELEVALFTNGTGQVGVMQMLLVELEVPVFTNAAAAVTFPVKFVFWFAEQTFNAALDCLTKLFEEFSGKFSEWWT